MTSPIERIRYYDGEYLRAFDFAAEQGYHIDMRRRLNIGAAPVRHRRGIAAHPTSNKPVSARCSIGTGMAIDPYGREMYLLAPYTFDDTADVQANHITAEPESTRSGSSTPRCRHAAIGGLCRVQCEQPDDPMGRRPARSSCSVSSTPSVPPAVTDDISEGDPDPTPPPGSSWGSSRSRQTLPPVHSRPDLAAATPTIPLPCTSGFLAQRVVCPVESDHLRYVEPSKTRRAPHVARNSAQRLYRAELDRRTKISRFRLWDKPSPEPPDAGIRARLATSRLRRICSFRVSSTPAERPTFAHSRRHLRGSPWARTSRVFLPDIQMGTTLRRSTCARPPAPQPRATTGTRAQFPCR